MLKYIIIICLFLNGCTAYKNNQLEKKIIKKQQSWLNIQYLAMKKPQLTNKKGTMETEIKQKMCDDCQQQVSCVEIEDGECCGEKLISHLCTDCHINQQDNEQI